MTIWIWHSNCVYNMSGWWIFNAFPNWAGLQVESAPVRQDWDGGTVFIVWETWCLNGFCVFYECLVDVKPMVNLWYVNCSSVVTEWCPHHMIDVIVARGTAWCLWARRRFSRPRGDGFQHPFSWSQGFIRSTFEGTGDMFSHVAEQQYRSCVCARSVHADLCTGSIHAMSFSFPRG